MKISTSETTQRQFAGLGRRFVALVIDLVILSAIFFPVTRLVKGVWLMSASDHLWGLGWLITDPLCIGYLFGMFAYFVILEGVFGATVGKKLAGVRVVSPGGDRPGFWRGFVRNLLRLVDGLPALNILGVVLILSSPERARFGDRVAGTRVVIRHRPGA